MTLTATELAALAARATTPLERAARAPANGHGDAPGDGEHERRLARWRGLLGGEAGLDRRLALAGLDREGVARALAPAPPGAAGGAEWSTFADVLHGIDTERTTWRFVDPERPVPWDTALAPLVAATAALLERRAGTRAGLDLLEPAARAGLERNLLERLAELASPTLRHLYERADAPPAANGRTSAEAIAEGRRRRDGFCRGVVASAYRPLLAEHPVLARLLATATHLWVESTAEFLERLEADRDALAAHLPGVRPGDRVARVRGGVSDPHHRGRSALILTFPSGRRVVYKPRELRGEATWFALLAWLVREAGFPAMRTLEVLERDGYGWVEFAEPAAPEGEQELARYAERCGALLALCYALGGTDVHFENVVPIGDEPVLVDIETVMHPRLGAPGVEGAAHSVLSVGLLPSWIELVPDVAFDMSAVGGASGRPPVRFGRVVGAGAADTPGGLGEHAGALVEGFRAAYDALRRVAPALGSADGPLAAFAHADMRLVVRPTRTYVRLIGVLTMPDRLRDGRDWGVELEALARAGVGDEEAEALWPIVAAEVAAVTRLDVPRFTVRADAAEVDLDGGGRLGGAIAVAPLEEARRRLGRLDDGDRERQLALLEATFTARSAAARGGATRSSRHPLPLPDPAPLATVGAIAGEIVRRAEPAGDGLAWIVYDGDLAAGTVGVREAGPGLASGYAGIALVLALAGHVLDDDDLAAAARAAYARLLTGLAGSVTRGWGRIGPGARNGMGGVLFSLAEGARALDDAALGRAAARLADPEVTALIGRERRTGVADGLAGAVLGLLALGELADGAATLVDACAERLGELGAEGPSPSSVPWWAVDAPASPGPLGHRLDELAAGRAGEVDALAGRGPGGQPDEARRAARALAADAAARGGLALRLPPHGPVCLPGLAHGLAGVAYALLRGERRDLPCLGTLRPGAPVAGVRGR